MLLALVLSMANSHAAQGGLADPHSWKRVSGDGQFVLVMISPYPIDKDAVVHPAYDTEGIRRLRATYTRSGLYHNDGSTEPVWTIQYAMENNVFLTTDGKRLILADQPWRSNGHIASFYANGKLLRRCNIGDLIQSELQLWIWELRGGVNCSNLRLSDAQQTFTIGTNQGETFVFDITTGRLLRRTSRYPLYFGIAAVILVTFSAVAFGYLIRRRNGIRSRGQEKRDRE